MAAPEVAGSPHRVGAQGFHGRRGASRRQGGRVLILQPAERPDDGLQPISERQRLRRRGQASLELCPAVGARTSQSQTLQRRAITQPAIGMLQQPQQHDRVQRIDGGAGNQCGQYAHVTSGQALAG